MCTLTPPKKQRALKLQSTLVSDVGQEEAKTFNSQKEKDVDSFNCHPNNSIQLHYILFIQRHNNTIVSRRFLCVM